MPSLQPPDSSQRPVQTEHNKPHVTLTSKEARHGQRGVKRLNPVALLKRLMGRQESDPVSKPPASSLLERTVTKPEDQKRYTPLPKANKASDVLPEFQPGKVKEAPDFDSARTEKLLGRGAFGQVHLVSNQTSKDDIEESPTLLQKQYVVKTQDFSHKPSDDIEKQYQAAEREFDLQKQVPDTVKVNGQRRVRSGHQVMMEYGGTELTTLLKSGKHRALPLSLARDLGRQMMEQVQKSHDQGIVHRDIKPENLLVNHQGKISLADFGLSRQHAGGEANAGQEFSGIAGTPIYIAPEVFQGKRYSYNADVWSAGLVVAEMVFGKRPHFLYEYYDRDGDTKIGFDSSAVKRFRKKLTNNKKEFKVCSAVDASRVKKMSNV